MKCNCRGGNNKLAANVYSQVQHYNWLTMNRLDLSTNGAIPMRATTSAPHSAPVKNTIIQIALLLAAFGTSGTMFAATLV
jgi:hypothetical protein